MIKEKLYKVLSYLNQKGFPLPTLRDPKTGNGSITLTMFWISFNIAIVTLAGKISKVFGEINYNDVLWLLTITGGMYLGRKMQTGKDGVKLDEESK